MWAQPCRNICRGSVSEGVCCGPLRHHTTTAAIATKQLEQVVSVYLLESQHSCMFFAHGDLSAGAATQ